MTFVINMVGAFVPVLVLPEPLGRAHPLAGRFVGTGLLGAFTTTSAVAVETALLLRDRELGIAAT